MSPLTRFRDWWHADAPEPRSAVPAPPCGAMSRKLGATVEDLRRMGFLDPPQQRVKGQKGARPPKPWRRVCVCALGHDGEWHRSEDGQVWHDSDALTPKQVAAEEEAERADAEALVKAMGSWTVTATKLDD